jgi:hypothetical protein
MEITAMADLGKPIGKARETRRGGRKGSPPGGRSFRPGTRGDRDTPRANAAKGEEDVTRESTEPRHDEGPRAGQRLRRVKE